MTPLQQKLEARLNELPFKIKDEVNMEMAYLTKKQRIRNKLWNEKARQKLKEELWLLGDEFRIPYMKTFDLDRYYPMKGNIQISLRSDRKKIMIFGVFFAFTIIGGIVDGLNNASPGQVIQAFKVMGYILIFYIFSIYTNETNKKLMVMNNVHRAIEHLFEELVDSRSI